MRPRTFATALLLATLSLLVSACGGDSSTGPDDGGGDSQSGFVSFTYSGQRSGSFSASGAFATTTDGTPTAGPWSVGALKNGRFALLAARPSGSASDVFMLYLENVDGPGDYALDAFGSGAVGLLAFSADLADIQNLDVTQPGVFFFSTGTVRIQSLSGDRGKGTLQDLNGVNADGQHLFITSGTFDVLVLPEDPLGGGELP